MKVLVTFTPLRLLGVFWMLVGAAGLGLGISAFLTWQGGYDRWLDTSIVVVPSCALIGGGYGLARLRRWAKLLMVIEMSLLLLWCVGWLLDAEDTLSIRLLVCGCIGALLTLLTCLLSLIEASSYKNVQERISQL